MRLPMDRAIMRTQKIEDVMVNYFGPDDMISFHFMVGGYIIDFTMEDITEVQRLAKLKEFAGVSAAKELEGKELRWVNLYAVGHPTEDRFVCLHGDTQELTKAELMQKLNLTEIFE